MAALVLQAMVLLCVPGQAFADMRVNYVTIEQQAGFASNRVYAGTAVAGRAAHLGFKQPGEIGALAVDIGDRVERSAVLATLDSKALQAALQQAQADVAFAEASMAAQRADTQLAVQTEARFRNLRKKGHVSLQEYDEVRLALQASEARLKVAEASQMRALASRRAARIALDEARIVAPFAGVVQQRLLDEGSQVVPGQAVLRLVASDSIEAHIGVPASVAVGLQPEQGYSVFWNDTEYEAVLRAVPPEIDTATRTMTAVFELGDAKVPLGAVVELTIEQEVASPGFWVPIDALTESDRGLWGLYVVNADLTVERRLVEVVHNESSRVYVRGTLADADRVVSAGTQRIVPGQRVELGNQDVLPGSRRGSGAAPALALN